MRSVLSPGTPCRHCHLTIWGKGKEGNFCIQLEGFRILLIKDVSADFVRQREPVLKSDIID
jgi:hypothetical protein